MSPFDPPRPVAPSESLPEGAEAPPPGVRTMAAVRWTLVAVMAVLAAGAWVSFATGSSHENLAAVRYQCPMHPAVLQDAPGQCPICGMDLVGVSAKAEQGKAAAEEGGAGAAIPGLAPVVIDSVRAQRIGVRTALVERRPLGADLRIVGVVSVNERGIATVSSRVTGWIEELHAREGGQPVRKGQALATVYSPEMLSAQQAMVAAPMWNPAQAGANPAAAGAFGIDPQKRLELLGMAQQDVAELHRTGQIRYAQPIRSPIDGYVARRGAYAGQYVQPGVELFQIVDLSTVWVIAEVYESDLPRTRPGQRAQVTLEALPGQRFTGTVEYLYPALGTQARTLEARIVLRNPGLKLRPGMTAQVLLETAPREALSVPAEAVVDTGERRYVFVAGEGGRFEPRQVRTGERADDRVEILDGVADGERVVTTAAFLVDSESRLRAAVETFSGAAP